MFERYDNSARRVIFFARYEASNYGSKWIETHHLLLGLLRENWDLFEPFLKSPDQARAIDREIEERFPRQSPIETSADMPLSHASKRVLAYAAEEAERLGQKRIQSVHLLLGLLREQESVAAEILRRHGFDLDALRQSAMPPPAYPEDAYTERAALHWTVRALPADRWEGAWRILAALGEAQVRVDVASPKGRFTISYGE